MESVHSIDQSPGWSISRIAREWAPIDRRTVAKLLEGVQPCGKVRGNKVYRVKDFAPALVRYTGGISDPTLDEEDPSRLPPMERKAWYESEQKRLKVEEEKGRLISDHEFETTMVEAFKQLKTVLVTMPDVLERDANLAPEQVIKAQKIIDSGLSQLYQALVDDSESID